MTELRLHTNGEDPELTRELRALYAAPEGEAYWSELEERVMQQVGDLELGWVAELDRWIRPALVAAAVLVLASGVALFRAHESDKRVAYDNLLSPTPVPVETAARPMQQGTREATLRFLIAR